MVLYQECSLLTRQVHSLIFEVIIIIFFHWEMEKGRIQPNYRLHVVCNLHVNGRKPLYYIPSTIHHLEIKRLSNLLKHGGLQLLSIISPTEKLVEIMIVSITDSLDDDDDNRKEGSKGGVGVLRRYRGL